MHRNNKHSFSLHQVLDMIDADDYTAADIFITPPDVSELTDEDSGEEDGSGLVDNLNRNMLNVEAEAVIVNKNNEIVNIGREEDASSEIRNALDLKKNAAEQSHEQSHEYDDFTVSSIGDKVESKPKLLTSTPNTNKFYGTPKPKPLKSKSFNLNPIGKYASFSSSEVIESCKWKGKLDGKHGKKQKTSRRWTDADLSSSEISVSNQLEQNNFARRREITHHTVWRIF